MVDGWKALPERLTPAECDVMFRVKVQVTRGACMVSSSDLSTGPSWAERDRGWASGATCASVAWAWVSHQLWLRDARRLMCQRELLRDLHGLVLYWPHPPCTSHHVLAHLTQPVSWENTWVYLSMCDCLSSPCPVADFILTRGNEYICTQCFT